MMVWVHLFLTTELLHLCVTYNLKISSCAQVGVAHTNLLYLFQPMYISMANSIYDS